MTAIGTRSTLTGLSRNGTRRCTVYSTTLRSGKRTTGKLRHLSPGTVIDALDWHIAQGEDISRLNAYQCDRCGSVHLGHRPKYLDRTDEA